MTIELDVQRATDRASLPGDGHFELWVGTALKTRPGAVLTIRLVDEEESRELNAQYRGIDRATNVLSFPAELPPAIGIDLLGDIVICAPLVAREAERQGKSEIDHWAHLVIHGILHLLGRDHQESSEAREMESLETEFLESLGIPDPYV